MSLTEQFGQMQDALSHLEPVWKALYEQVFSPALARAYDSQLKPGRGLLKTALTKTGARGNVCRIQGNEMTLGVDYAALPYAKFVIEGRGPVRAKPGKVLRFYDDAGKPIFRKSVGPAPAHDIVNLSDETLKQASEVASQMLGFNVEVVRLS